MIRVAPWFAVCLIAAAGAETSEHVARAAHLMQDRLFSEAGAEFELALKAAPNDAPVRFQYAECLFAQGRNDEARQQFETVRRQTGESHALAYYLGRLDLLAGHFDAALVELRPLQSDDKLPRAPYYLGLAYLSAGNAAEGIRCLEVAASRTPRDPQVHYRLGRAYSMAGRKDDADREYKLYNDGREGVRTTEQDVRACAKALRTESIDAARPVCRKVGDPNDSGRLVLLGQLYGENGAYEDAVEPLRRAVQLDSGSFEAWHDLGLSLFRLKRYRDARAPLEHAAALNPDFAETLNLLAATLYVLHDDAAALPVLERLHALRPGDAQVAAALEQLRASQKH